MIDWFAVIFLLLVLGVLPAVICFGALRYWRRHVDPDVGKVPPDPIWQLAGGGVFLLAGVAKLAEIQSSTLLWIGLAWLGSIFFWRHRSLRSGQWPPVMFLLAYVTTFVCWRYKVISDVMAVSVCVPVLLAQIILLQRVSKDSHAR